MDSALKRFLEEREKFEIPSGDVARVKLLAKELALGVHRDLWPSTVTIFRGESILFRGALKDYEEHRWADDIPTRSFSLLQGHGYVETGLTANGKRNYRLSQAAFDLLQEIPPFNVFISYTHQESSAFALLLITKLRQYGIQPFCDMSLVPGEDWHPELEKQIMKCEHFIVLVGKETRNSGPTIKEVKWALENKKIVIPIWHNGFKLKLDEWTRVNDDVVEAIERKHAVIVEKESAAGYNAAVTELLANRFGITP